MDMIFSLRQQQEKTREHEKYLLITFVVLAKAFDTVSSAAFWVVFRKVDVPDKMLSVVMSFTQGMMASESETMLA